MFCLNRGVSIVERKSTVDGGGMFPSAQVRQSMTFATWFLLKLGPKKSFSGTTRENQWVFGIPIGSPLELQQAIRALNSWPFEDGTRLTVKKKGPPRDKGEGKGDRVSYH
jgi:hypothetical protein